MMESVEGSNSWWKEALEYLFQPSTVLVAVANVPKRVLAVLLLQIQSEVEKKAVQVGEQRQEHLQLVEAHATISQSLELTRAERHELQKKVAALKAEADRSAKHVRCFFLQATS